MEKLRNMDPEEAQKVIQQKVEEYLKNNKLDLQVPEPYDELEQIPTNH